MTDDPCYLDCFGTLKVVRWYHRLWCYLFGQAQIQKVGPDVQLGVGVRGVCRKGMC